MSYTLGELAEKAGVQLQGDESYVITGVASLVSAGSSEIGFFCDPSLIQDLQESSAGAMILNRSDSELFQGRQF